MSHKATCDYKSGSVNVIINWTWPKLQRFGRKQDYWWLELDFNDVNVIIALENDFHSQNGCSPLPSSSHLVTYVKLNQFDPH